MSWTVETEGGPAVVVVDGGMDAAARHINEHRGEVDDLLFRHGAVVFRSDGQPSVQGFTRVRNAVLRAVTPYVERATPRVALGDEVFTSTEFPRDATIAQHNENSYALSWPGHLVFGCIVPADRGGATPVADVRRVLAGIPAEVVDEFVRRSWRLVRNYNEGFGLPWQEAFDTTDTAEVEAYCARSGIDWEWNDDGSLRTQQVRPVLARHPLTGEVVWFNHVHFWHASSLDPDVREVLVDEFSEEGTPFTTLYGDGGLIPDEVVATVRDAFAAETRACPWQAGDVMVVDNMLAAHGREPYEGERQIVVSMGNPIRRNEAVA